MYVVILTTNWPCYKDNALRAMFCQTWPSRSNIFHHQHSASYSRNFTWWQWYLPLNTMYYYPYKLAVSVFYMSWSPSLAPVSRRLNIICKTSSWTSWRPVAKTGLRDWSARRVWRLKNVNRPPFWRRISKALKTSFSDVLQLKHNTPFKTGIQVILNSIIVGF